MKEDTFKISNRNVFIMKTIRNENNLSNFVVQIRAAKKKKKKDWRVRVKSELFCNLPFLSIFFHPRGIWNSKYFGCQNKAASNFHRDLPYCLLNEITLVIQEELIKCTCGLNKMH
jgi:hypothetical protein